MNAPINTVSILSKCYEHQQRLDNVFKDLSNDMTLSAINHLKGNITEKDQIIDNLQAKMGSLMERLSDAEQKLFEL